MPRPYPNARSGLVSRLSLSQRVFASSAVAVLLVVLAFAAVAHHSLQRAASRWAREDLAALGHHVAAMVLAAVGYLGKRFCVVW